jgi:hypothetical protein
MVNISQIKRIALLIIPAILLPIVFTYDVIRAAVEFDFAGMTILRELSILIHADRFVHRETTKGAAAQRSERNWTYIFCRCSFLVYARS